MRHAPGRSLTQCRPMTLTTASFEPSPTCLRRCSSSCAVRVIGTGGRGRAARGRQRRSARKIAGAGRDDAPSKSSSGSRDSAASAGASSRGGIDGQLSAAEHGFWPSKGGHRRTRCPRQRARRLRGPSFRPRRAPGLPPPDPLPAPFQPGSTRVQGNAPLQSMISTDPTRSPSSTSRLANVPGPAVISSRSSGRGGASGLAGSDDGGLTSCVREKSEERSQRGSLGVEPEKGDWGVADREQHGQEETDLEALHHALPDLLAQVADRPAAVAAVLLEGDLPVVEDVGAVEDPVRRRRGRWERAGRRGRWAPGWGAREERRGLERARPGERAPRACKSELEGRTRHARGSCRAKMRAVGEGRWRCEVGRMDVRQAAGRSVELAGRRRRAPSSGRRRRAAAKAAGRASVDANVSQRTPTGKPVSTGCRAERLVWPERTTRDREGACGGVEVRRSASSRARAASLPASVGVARRAGRAAHPPLLAPVLRPFRCWGATTPRRRPELGHDSSQQSRRQEAVEAEAERAIRRSSLEAGLPSRASPYELQDRPSLPFFPRNHHPSTLTPDPFVRLTLPALPPLPPVMVSISTQPAGRRVLSIGASPSPAASRPQNPLAHALPCPSLEGRPSLTRTLALLLSRPPRRYQGPEGARRARRRRPPCVPAHQPSPAPPPLLCWLTNPAVPPCSLRRPYHRPRLHARDHHGAVKAARLDRRRDCGQRRLRGHPCVERRPLLRMGCRPSHSRLLLTRVPFLSPAAPQSSPSPRFTRSSRPTRRFSRRSCRRSRRLARSSSSRGLAPASTKSRCPTSTSTRSSTATRRGALLSRRHCTRCV